MFVKAAKLSELQQFCNEQFKVAEGDNAKLLSADEVKRITSVRNMADDAVKEYEELARNYQDLLKDYKELVTHTSTPDKSEEVINPAGNNQPAKFDMEKFKEEFLKNMKKD